MSIALLPFHKAKEACADSDPFCHSPCNKYYWKAIAVGYLAVCVLLAIIYVAIYAEQHGLYGSYYDNLENLGRPLTPQTENVRFFCCIGCIAADTMKGSLLAKPIFIVDVLSILTVYYCMA